MTDASRRRRWFRAVAVSAIVASIVSVVDGSITTFSEQTEWLGAAGPSDSIDFVLGSNQILSDQYSSLGVTFTGGDDFAKAAGAFGLDGWGVATNSLHPPRIELEFDVPRYAFAGHYTGVRGFILFADGIPIYENVYFDFGLVFFGVTTTVPFDEVWLIDPAGHPAFDNIYFSQASIPTPGAIALLALGALTGSRRRARGS